MLRFLKEKKHPSDLVLLLPAELATVGWVSYSWSIFITNTNSKKNPTLFYCLPDHILSTTTSSKAWLGSHLLWTYFSLWSVSKSFAMGTNTFPYFSGTWRSALPNTTERIEFQGINMEGTMQFHVVYGALKTQTGMLEQKSKDFVTLEAKMPYLSQFNLTTRILGICN